MTMHLIVCLGNPGKEYEKTRHNVGFIAAAHLIKAYNLQKKSTRFKSILYTGEVGEERVILMLPQTYMNLSGEAVQLVKAFYKIDPPNILVIFDDFELDFGTIRIREKGSAGTHNGMKSIITTLNTQNFPRLRIGIGPKPEQMDTTAFVLGKFSSNETKNLPEIYNRVVESVTLIITDSINTAMNHHNRPKKPSPTPPL